MIAVEELYASVGNKASIYNATPKEISSYPTPNAQGSQTKSIG
jgi:hypothetical protein